jgi:hypothetical protein
MKFTDNEKVMLLVLADIQDKVPGASKIRSDTLRRAINDEPLALRQLEEALVPPRNR